MPGLGVSQPHGVPLIPPRNHKSFNTSHDTDLLRDINSHSESRHLSHHVSIPPDNHLLYKHPSHASRHVVEAPAATRYLTSSPHSARQPSPVHSCHGQYQPPLSLHAHDASLASASYIWLWPASPLSSCDDHLVAVTNAPCATPSRNMRVCH